jgi:hypothetical protein
MYSFDATNCPVFTGTLTAGNVTPRIPLKLDKDADFYLRAISTHGTPSLRIEDADGNPLFDSENATQSTNYAHPHKYSFTNGAGFVTLESGTEGIPARAGGTFLLYLYNQTASSINLTTFALNLVGVKRYGPEKCK